MNPAHRHPGEPKTSFSHCSEPDASKCPESDFFYWVISSVILASSNQVRPAWTLYIWVRETNYYCVVSVLILDLIIPSHFQFMQETSFFLTHLVWNITGVFMGLLQKTSQQQSWIFHDKSVCGVSVSLDMPRQPAASRKNEGQTLPLHNGEQIAVLMWTYLGWDMKQGNKPFMC